MMHTRTNNDKTSHTFHSFVGRNDAWWFACPRRAGQPMKSWVDAINLKRRIVPSFCGVDVQEQCRVVKVSLYVECELQCCGRHARAPGDFVKNGRDIDARINAVILLLEKGRTCVLDKLIL